MRVAGIPRCPSSAARSLSSWRRPCRHLAIPTRSGHLTSLRPRSPRLDQTAAAGRSQGVEDHSVVGPLERRQVVRLRARARTRATRASSFDRRARTTKSGRSRSVRRGRRGGGAGAAVRRRRRGRRRSRSVPTRVGWRSLFIRRARWPRAADAARVVVAAAGRASRGASAAARLQNKLALVNLATGEKKEFDRVRRYAFNGDKPTWLAIQAPPELARRRGNAAGGARGGAKPASGTARPVESRARTCALQPRRTAKR